MAKQEIRSTHLTYEDYVQFPDDGKRHEIIEGDHYMTPAPKIRHQRLSAKLSSKMITLADQHGLGLVLTAPCDVVLSDENVVQPDIVFVSAARAAIVTEDNIQGAPDLIIEILSESSRKKDEVTKRKLYERFGVLEYWLVDPELEIVKIFKLAQQKYGRALELSKESNDVLTTALLPGLSFAVSEIFE